MGPPRTAERDNQWTDDVTLELGIDEGGEVGEKGVPSGRFELGACLEVLQTLY